jgi:hypothetical protein
MLFEALADYTNSHLLAETCAPGQLRRLESSGAIEQVIITTYQVQNEIFAVSDCYRVLSLRDATANAIACTNYKLKILYLRSPTSFFNLHPRLVKIIEVRNL